MAPLMAIDWGAELDDLRAIGHGASTLFYAAIVVAIVAVVLSAQSNSVGILQQAFALLQWLVQQVVAPVTGGKNIPLTSTLTPAGQLAGTASGSSASGGSTFANLLGGLTSTTGTGGGSSADGFTIPTITTPFTGVTGGGVANSVGGSGGSSPYAGINSMTIYPE